MFALVSPEQKLSPTDTRPSIVMVAAWVEPWAPRPSR